MSLRTRLILAFFLLAVVPLCGVSLYSYRTTERAFRKAVEAEAAATAEDVNARLASVTRELDRRFERMSDLPFADVARQRHADDATAQKLMADLQREMGDAAPWLKSLEFIPATPPAPAPPAPHASDAQPSLDAPPRHAPPPAGARPPRGAEPPLGAPPLRGGPPPAAAPPPAGARAGVPAPPAPPAAGEMPRALVIAPEPPAPGADASAGGQPVWVFKYKAIAEAAAAAGAELAEEAQRIGAEIEKQQRQIEKQQAKIEKQQRANVEQLREEQRQVEAQLRATEAERREAAQAARQAAREAARAEQDARRAAAPTEAGAEREAALQKNREDLAQTAVRAAQLAMSPKEEDKREAVRLATEVARIAGRHAGAVMAQKSRMRFAPRSGYRFDYQLKKDGAELGTVRAQVEPHEVLSNVFTRTRRRQGEIPFAVDAEGKLYAADADRAQLAPLRLQTASAGSGTGTRVESKGDWVVVTRQDPETGLTLGIARPIGSGLKDIRGTAFKNLAYGLGMTGLALVGILPLSHRLTRDLGALTEGASKLAHGDLGARVPVRSGDEVGRLAAAFNKMAGDLRAHQEQLLEQERLRKELELGRRIQAEMLPHEGLLAPFAEAKGISIPAREVGGDFFNYFLLDDGQAALIVGDVSGKGVGAALLMANLQATLRARLPLEKDLTALARHLDHEIDRTTSTTVYLTAVIALLDGKRGVLRYVNAGHNPPFLLRSDGGILALDSTGRPLGLYPGGDYEEKELPFAEGDSLLLYTDGIVESEDETGEPFGGERLQELLYASRAEGIDSVLARVERAVREHRGGREADDDATLLLLKAGPTLAGPATPAV